MSHVVTSIESQETGEIKSKSTNLTPAQLSDCKTHNVATCSCPRCIHGGPVSGFSSPCFSFASFYLYSKLRDQLSRLPPILRAAFRMGDSGPSNAIHGIAFVLPFFPGNRGDHARKLARNKRLDLANGHYFVRFRIVRFHF